MRPACQTLIAYHAAVSPLLASSSLRVDVAGTPAIDGLTLESTGQWLLVLGASRGLFEAASGLRDIEHGDLLVGGASPVFASRAGAAAAAPLDPPLPPRWTVFQYIRWSARLSGLSGASCEASVRDALDRLQLLPHRSARLGTASVTVRRGTVIGAAMATGARILLLEDPIAGLGNEAEGPFSRVVARALLDRSAVFFAGRVALDSPVAIAADEAIVIDGSSVVAQGPPAEMAVRTNTFGVRVVGDVEALRKALADSGCDLRGSERGVDADRFTVSLGNLGTGDLLRVAEASHAVVLELRPLTRVFA
jgi:ABC-type multidrug transport system ATPase subunit